MLPAAELASALGPELIRGVQVIGVKPDLGNLAITGVEDPHSMVMQPPPGSFAVGRVQRDGVLVIGNNIVQIQAQGAAGKLEGPAEELQHLTYALIIPGQLATAGDVPPDVFREVLAPQRVE